MKFNAIRVLCPAAEFGRDRCAEVWRVSAFGIYTLAVVSLLAQAAPSSLIKGAVVVEAEDFKPVIDLDAPATNTPSTKANQWKAIANGHGNYMVDIVGFNRISGEHLLSAPALAANTVAEATVTIPKSGKYRIWSRFEQPTNTENRFRVEIIQNGRSVGAALMGAKNAPKYFFGSNTPVAQADPSWGSEGLVEQSFDVEGLEAGPARITLTTVDQSKLGKAGDLADRNVDFLFLTQDLQNEWRKNSPSGSYPILDAELNALPTRYYLRLTSPQAQTISLGTRMNRSPWSAGEGNITLQADEASAWVPLRTQDVSNYSTIEINGTAGLPIRAEIASAPDDRHVIRAIDWQDPKSATLLLSLPPYPGKYKGQNVMTVEEQFRSISAYLQLHPSEIGRTPTKPLAWGGWIPVWGEGKVEDAAADLYNRLGMRIFVGVMSPNVGAAKAAIGQAKARFEQWGAAPTRSLGFGDYRFPPTPANIALVKDVVTGAEAGDYFNRFDYGDEISLNEWLQPFSAQELGKLFVAWQKKERGKVTWYTPDSSAKASVRDPNLYVDSIKFYESTAIDRVARDASAIPKVLGPQTLYGMNVSTHPFYYPTIATYVKWFRASPTGDYAANFGRQSEYFWEVGQPGPLVNGYIAEHFRSGMRDNHLASLIQYNMPHSPGNTDEDFRRSAFTHLAHGARGLDYFGIGINSSWTENFIDFRNPARYAAIRDINRSMAFVEDILPESRVVPSKIALILSDSTERWDFAGIATDKLGHSLFGDDYRKMRLAYHQERLGIYYALVHSSRPPDLLLEEDVQKGRLRDYNVAYWVGDCAEAATVKALRGWADSGGELIATAGALHFDEYHRPGQEGLKLLGLKTAKLNESARFFRPQIEMPRLKPLDWVGQMPALAITDAVSPAPGCQVLARFKSGGPAITRMSRGKGGVTYVATLPGVAYLWSAYQPPPVPSRGPSSHVQLMNFNPEARRWIVKPANTQMPSVDAHGTAIDARLLESPQGYAIPVANYAADTTLPVSLTIRGVPNLRAVISARSGKLALKKEADGSASIRYSPGIGDMLRLETME